MEEEESKVKLVSIDERILEALKIRDELKERIKVKNNRLEEVLCQNKTIIDFIGNFCKHNKVTAEHYAPPNLVKNYNFTYDRPIFINNLFPYTLAIYDFGTPLSMNPKFFIKPKVVYPLGYVCKRVYKIHGTENSKNLVIYTCRIKKMRDRPIIEITNAFGFNLAARPSEIFDHFVSAFNGSVEFSNIDEFCGLSYPEVKKFLFNNEKKDNLSSVNFINY